MAGWQLCHVFQASVQTYTLWILLYKDFKLCYFLELYHYSSQFSFSLNIIFFFFEK